MGKPWIPDGKSYLGLPWVYDFSWACLLPVELLQKIPLWDMRFQSQRGSCTCAMWIPSLCTWAVTWGAGRGGGEEAKRPFPGHLCKLLSDNYMLSTWSPIEEAPAATVPTRFSRVWLWGPGCSPWYLMSQMLYGAESLGGPGTLYLGLFLRRAL